MADDAHQRLRRQNALKNFGMAVLMAAETVEGVVKMYRLEPVKTDHAVKLGKHRVRVGDDVVAAVPDVACVETDAELVFKLHAVDDLAQLLKLSADLAALSGHRLQKHRCVHVRRENRV